MTACVAVGIGCTVLGMALGALASTLWAIRWLTKPANAQEFLRRMYDQSHPHWLQRSETDPARVCPCCGWGVAQGETHPVAPA